MTVTTSPSTIDAILSDAVEAGRTAGVIAAAADASGMIYEGAAGRRAADAEAAMTTDTVCWIASMTKAVTGTAAVQLVEQGRLDLDEPIAEVLPQLADPQVLEGWNADGTPRLRPARGTVTLRNLLTHTSGYSYYIWNEDCDRYITHAGLPSILSCENAALNQPLMFDPGERWEYGIGIDFAGKAVEAVSGQRLDAYLQDNIFTPLAMTDTGFVPGAAQRDRLASMHARLPDGSLAVIPFAMPEAPEFHMGGGGLFSTAGDYLRFLRMLLGGGALEGTRVLQAETVAAMAQNHIGDLEVKPMVSVAPTSSHDVDFFPDMAKKWGLTFMITTEDAPTGRRAGSLAWAGLANSYYWVDLESNVAGVVITQILPFADPGAIDLFERFETAVYDGR